MPVIAVVRSVEDLDYTYADEGDEVFVELYPESCIVESFTWNGTGWARGRLEYIGGNWVA